MLASPHELTRHHRHLPAPDMTLTHCLRPCPCAQAIATFVFGVGVHPSSVGVTLSGAFKYTMGAYLRNAIFGAVDGEELAGSADGCGAFDCCMGDEDAGQDKRATSSKRKWKGTTGGVLATLDNTGWLRVWHLQGISWEPVLEGPHTASNVVRTLWNSHLQVRIF